MTLSRHTKFLTALGGAAVLAAQVALTDGEFTKADVVTIVLAVVTAAAVWLAPKNSDPLEPEQTMEP